MKVNYLSPSNAKGGFCLIVVTIALGLGRLGAAEPSETKTAEEKDGSPNEEETTEYRNWLDLGLGGLMIRGDNAAAQQRLGVPDTAFGGVDEFHFEQDVGKRALFSMDGRGIFNNDDYSLRLELVHPDKGYVRAGFSEFKSYYDGSGGFFPRNDRWISLYDEQFSINRGEVWFEAGLTLPDKPELRFKYTHQFRDGKKDSASWGDTGLTGLPGPNNIRGIVPSFWDIDETRDIFEGDVKHSLGDTALGLGLRYEISDLDNSRNIHRRPTEASDRYLTQKDEVHSDMFSVHAFSETRFNPTVLFTSGYSFTTLDTDIGGSRIYGSDYDSIYDPVFARRQPHDEGFLNLSGGSQLKQHVANLNLMLTPWEHVAIIPALRIEHQDQDGFANFVETDVGNPPGLTATQESLSNTRERGFTDVSQSLEARYTGITNWVWYVRGEWLEGEGDLKEREKEAQTGLVSRDTDSTRFTQKYIIGANWYPVKRFNLSGQYYYKVRQNDYDHTLDSTVNTSGDRYPAYLKEQDFDTHDMNVRVTWRPLNYLTLITRYDFQLSTINTRPDLLAKLESAENTAHIISESISWTPFNFLYVQGSLNYVMNQTDTPASKAIPGKNLVLNMKNNYWNASALVGIALSEKTDLQTQYSYYRADNYEDNSAFSQPYGAGTEDQSVMVSLIHKFTRQLQWTVRYGFFTSRNETSGGHNNYDAHLIYSSMRYSF